MTNTSKNLKILSLFTFSIILATSLATRVIESPVFRTNPNQVLASKEKFSGETKIFKDDFGFFTEVWLANETLPLTTEPFIPTKMMIGLAQSGTFLSGECFMFKPYNCTELNCTHAPNSQPRDVHYPYFSSEITNAKQTVTVNNGSWTLHTHADIGSSCTPEDLAMFGFGRAGVVNFGTALEVTNHEIFSIFLAKNLTQGKIFFRKEASMIEANTPNFTLKTTSNWRAMVSTEKGSINTGSKNVSFSGDIFFDVHAENIGLPSQIYDQVFAALKNSTNITCVTEETKMNCTGSQEKMPTLTLQINDVAIPIPPQVYTKAGATNKNFILGLKSLSPTFEGPSHISTVFKDSIVLDQNLMSYYYTVFEDVNKSHTVTLYHAHHPKEEATGPGGLNKNIIFVAGGVILIIVILYFVQLQMRKKKLHNALLEESVTEKLTEKDLNAI